MFRDKIYSVTCLKSRGRGEIRLHISRSLSLHVSWVLEGMPIESRVHAHSEASRKQSLLDVAVSLNYEGRQLSLTISSIR
jgi:hypothetical protein